MISKEINKTAFSVPSNLDEIPVATKKVFDFLTDLNLGDSDRFDIRLCFEEMLINAMKHGNGFNPHVHVDVRISYNASEVFLSIVDKGSGFKVTDVRNPTEQQNLERNGGRGVFLVKHLMDDLQYLDNGTRVEMRKTVKKQS